MLNIIPTIGCLGLPIPRRSHNNGTIILFLLVTTLLLNNYFIALNLQDHTIGQKGKEILEIDVTELYGILILLMQMVVFRYQYFLYAQVIEGIDAETLKAKLEKQSNHEMNHAKEFN